MCAAKTKTKTEFGDFQTPPQLARLVCKLLKRLQVRPLSIVEPTCGQGSLLTAALEELADANVASGYDINPDYVERTREHIKHINSPARILLKQADFFQVDWCAEFRQLPEPLLIIGNPPWVTNSQLASLGSLNLPTKRNAGNLTGLDALTGKSNFDICLWMLMRLLEAIENRQATIAMLCKTSVARKLLAFAWKKRLPITTAKIFQIDAQQYFSAAVDACLLVCQSSGKPASLDCEVFPSLAADTAETRFGYRDEQLVANIETYDRWKHLQGAPAVFWRSGIKHDCSRVMELEMAGNRFRNGLNEIVDLEPDYLFPMLKGSDIVTHIERDVPVRHMIVTQRKVGEETSPIAARAPKTWQYLNAHASKFDARRSRIYHNKPPFSIFGVGPYSFTPFKVAISGLHKQLRFSLIGSVCGKPLVLDDTAYFLPCETRMQAENVCRAMNSEPAQQFLSSLIFWDAKRPITATLLNKVDYRALPSAD